MPPGPDIFIDADACPVKDEVYKVARRYGLKTWVVSNAFMVVPASPMIERVIVDARPPGGGAGVAARGRPRALGGGPPHAQGARGVDARAAALTPTGKPFTENSIGSAIAQRALMEQLRSTGDIYGGPKPFDRNARSAFLQGLDQIVSRAMRNRR
jgi:uncharacterized protein YaiI (UPF0178 family)